MLARQLGLILRVQGRLVCVAVTLVPGCGDYRRPRGSTAWAVISGAQTSAVVKCVSCCFADLLTNGRCDEHPGSTPALVCG